GCARSSGGRVRIDGRSRSRAGRVPAGARGRDLRTRRSRRGKLRPASRGRRDAVQWRTGAFACPTSGSDRRGACPPRERGSKVTTGVMAAPMMPAQRAPVNKWLVTVSITFGTLMGAIDASIVNVAVPHLTGSLGATIEQITWVTIGFVIATVMVMPLTGR